MNTKTIQVVVSGGAGGTGGAGNSGGKGGAGGTQTTFIDNAGILTQLCIVNGGAGGNAGKSGNACSASGIWADTIETGLFNVVFTADQKFGTPGALVGADDKGGAGGASWLGNGGFYSDEEIVSAF